MTARARTTRIHRRIAMTRLMTIDVTKRTRQQRQVVMAVVLIMMLTRRAHTTSRRRHAITTAVTRLLRLFPLLRLLSPCLLPMVRVRIRRLARMASLLLLILLLLLRMGPRIAMVLRLEVPGTVLMLPPLLLLLPLKTSKRSCNKSATFRVC